MSNEKSVRVVSFVAAASNSGKTTLIENVLLVLKTRGVRVAVVKHASAGFDVDQPGKDSWRFRQAGADAVMIVGPDRLAITKTLGAGSPHAEIELLAKDVDIVIQEGFKATTTNKIEVFRAGISGKEPLCLVDRSFVALVSDSPFDVNIPSFDINDAHGVAEFLIASFVRA